MKILQLNVWTGRINGALPRFIKENDFDIICLQEAVWSDNRDLLEEFCVSVDQIKELSGLPYDSRATNWSIPAFDTEIHQGNAILSRYAFAKETKGIVFGKYGVSHSIQDLHNHCYTAQLVQLENGYNIVNYHGYYLPNPLGDNTAVEVMHKVAKLLQNCNGSIIMCGDLNVTHASPAMRELDFLNDLTHTYNIDTTLNGLKFDGKVPCDHILISNDIAVHKFMVSDELVSDHKALILEIK